MATAFKGGFEELIHNFGCGCIVNETTWQYQYIGIIVLAVAFAFTRVKLPEVAQMRRSTGCSAATAGFAPLFFVGLAALVAYEIAEISINTFFTLYFR